MTLYLTGLLADVRTLKLYAKTMNLAAFAQFTVKLDVRETYHYIECSFLAQSRAELIRCLSEPHSMCIDYICCNVLLDRSSKAERYGMYLCFCFRCMYWDHVYTNIKPSACAQREVPWYLPS